MSALQFDKVSSEILEKYIDDFFTRRLIFNNYFGIKFKRCRFIKTEHTQILRKPYIGFYRIYIMSDEEEDLKALLKVIDHKSCNKHPHKGDISIWDKVLLASGFL